ncbi:MAG: hypothetical protein Ct9H300mP14_03640 [Gammaproteobacteria bacterium]|nr:MAG: hypothetical protein Ct9H300mP14_03640 [Gammaproteobacteria bacterium]
MGVIFFPAVAGLQRDWISTYHQDTPLGVLFDPRLDSVGNTVMADVSLAQESITFPE